MTDTNFNKFRAAAAVLQRGRSTLVDTLAEEILDQSDELLDNGYQFHEFLENQGTRLHFLGLLLACLEQSAEELDEQRASAAAASAARKKPRRPRPAKKPLAEQAPRGETSRDRDGGATDEP
jgi:hypothetical protein